jgi:histidyl-tRNA synthetase
MNSPRQGGAASSTRWASSYRNRLLTPTSGHRVGFRLLQAVGITDASVLLNSIGDPEDRVAYRDLLTNFLTERSDRLSPDARRRMATNPLRVLDSKADAAVVADAPVPADHLGPAAAEHVAAVRRGLDAIGVPHREEPRLVRGLDYYNRTVFEYQSASYRAAQAALGGGGRYDPLAGMLGGPRHRAGCGDGCRPHRPGDAGRRGSTALDVYVVAADAAHATPPSDWCALSHRRLRADLDLGGKSVKAQFRAADRRGASAVAMVGEEWAAGRVTVKDLKSGAESSVEAQEVAAWIRRR